MEATKSQTFTPEDLRAEQERKRQSEDRKQRRQDIQNEIKLVKNDIERLRQLPPDIDQMITRWSSEIDAVATNFVSDMQIEARKGRVPELRPSARGYLQYFFGDQMKDRLMELACEVSGDSATASKQAQLGSAQIRLAKLMAEFNAMSG
ncbi:MAG: hypothetical protein HXL68_05390 [Dechloromonas agitata]|uniref:Uncharacterized protein n=1 Tax=Dechloromonas agitata TaxID=73030 RepID=A0A930BVD5_9RHOO|nr:hypothetical protein [Dechloromonas agitata]